MIVNIIFSSPFLIQSVQSPAPLCIPDSTLSLCVPPPSACSSKRSGLVRSRGSGTCVSTNVYPSSAHLLFSRVVSARFLSVCVARLPEVVDLAARFLALAPLLSRLRFVFRPRFTRFRVVAIRRGAAVRAVFRTNYFRHSLRHLTFSCLSAFVQTPLPLNPLCRIA